MYLVTCSPFLNRKSSTGSSDFLLADITIEIFSIRLFGAGIMYSRLCRHLSHFPENFVVIATSGNPSTRHEKYYSQLHISHDILMDVF